MAEIEELGVETVEGPRYTTPLGERLMIGLAAIALLGGVLIAGTNLLGAFAFDGVALQSGEPRDSQEPARTPSPSPKPRPLQDLTVIPGELPPFVAPERSPVYGFLEALSELVVVNAPTATASELGRLPAGSVLVAFHDWEARGDDGWLQTADPVANGSYGWIQLRDATGVERAVFQPVADDPRGGTVWSLAAGPDGFLALIAPPGSQFGPILVSSSNGEQWRAVDADPRLTAGGWVAASGPSGWLSATHVDGPVGPRLWIWEARAASDWSPLGTLGQGGSLWVSQLVGSDAGYLLVLDNEMGGSDLWASRDGVSWRESNDPFRGLVSDPRAAPVAHLQVAATDFGFFTWSWVQTDPEGGPALAFSVNGTTWHPVEIEDGIVSQLQLAQAGDALLGLGVAADGTVRAWRAELRGGSPPRLERAPLLERGFESMTIEDVFSDGVTAFALARQRSSGTVQLWSSSGRTWTRQPLPDAMVFGASRAQGTAGPGGVVLVGARPSSAGDNPVFWARRASGTWVAEREPIVPAVPDPTPEQCGPAPSTAVAFAVKEPWVALACHGDSPMTFVAWSWPAVFPGRGGGIGQPAWLMDEDRTLLLSPFESESWWGGGGVVHPDVAWQDGWANAWLRVTGHYADEAAATCQWNIGSDPLRVLHAAEAIFYCRQRFVITDVTVVDGPLATAAPY